jgi:hypothetical protein
MKDGIWRTVAVAVDIATGAPGANDMFALALLYSFASAFGSDLPQPEKSIVPASKQLIASSSPHCLFDKKAIYNLVLIPHLA